MDQDGVGGKRLGGIGSKSEHIWILTKKTLKQVWILAL